MNSRLRRRVIYGGFLLVLALFLVNTGQIHVSAATDIGQCDNSTIADWCGPSEDCEKECINDLFETTCGEYGGWFPIPEGPCLGECGDGTCNSYNNEEYGTCNDCGWCGDGKCQLEERGGQDYCSSDCGPDSPSYDECEPTEDDCSGGDFCNAQEACRPISECNQVSGICESNGDCCQDEVCLIDCVKYPWMCDYWGGELQESGVCVMRCPGGAGCPQ